MRGSFESKVIGCFYAKKIKIPSSYLRSLDESHNFEREFRLGNQMSELGCLVLKPLRCFKILWLINYHSTLKQKGKILVNYIL